MAEEEKIIDDEGHVHIHDEAIDLSSTIAEGWAALGFFAAAVVLTAQMMLKLGSNTRMTIIDAPMNLVYGVVLLGFAAMTFRSIQVARIHLRRGYSVLERPMTSLVEN